MLAKEIVPRALYATLFLYYAWYVATSTHGVSEQGLIPILEALPLVVLPVQVTWRTRILWWFMAVCAALYFGLLCVGIVPHLMLGGGLDVKDVYLIFGWATVIACLAIDLRLRVSARDTV
jgi:hypothetical protein